MVSRKMRMLAASLALVLCVSLYSVPKSKAVAVEAAAVSIGAAVLSSYLIATNMDLIGDTAETISNGVTSLVSDWVTASGVADSGNSWLSALGTAAQVRNPGVLIVPGALAAGCAAFVGWLEETFGLDEDGEEAVAVTGVSNLCSCNGLLFPKLPSDISEYSAQFICVWDGAYSLFGTNDVETRYQNTYLFWMYDSFKRYDLVDNVWQYAGGQSVSGNIGIGSLSCVVWANFDVLNLDGSVYLTASNPVSAGEFSLVRGSGFTNIANNAEEADELAIYTALPGVTLEDLAADIPAQIAAGTLAPTAELTQIGEGTNPEPDTDDEAVYPYFPVLNGIRDRLDNLGDSIVDGIMSGLKSLVVPDEAFFAEAVPALQETFQGRMGLLTFPISLLADFLGRLVDLSDQEPVLRWNSVSIYGTELIAAGQYNLKDALKSAPVKQMHDIYMIVVNAIMIFAFLNLCHNKYRKIMQN